MESDTFDVKAYLDAKGIKYTEAGAKNTTRGWINICCPFDDCSDQTNHCGVNLKTRLYSCWKCGGKGSIPKLVKAIEQCNWAKAFQITKQYLDPYAVTEEDEFEYARKVKIPAGISDVFTKRHLRFLEQRGFNPRQIIKKYKLLAGGINGVYKFRVVIPFYLDNVLVSFTARDVTGEAKVPYRNLPLEESVLDPKRIFYNMDNIKGNTALLVEGALDVWRIGDKCISSSGVKVTQEQINLLSDFGVTRLFIMFDGEVEAIQSAYAVANTASGIIRTVEVIELGEGADPCDLNRNEVREIKRMIR